MEIVEFSDFGRAQLMISTEVLIGSLNHIKKSNPHIFSVHPPVELRKMFFADVISAGFIFTLAIIFFGLTVIAIHEK